MQSPPLIRMKTSEMSPLVETIEVSETMLRNETRGGGGCGSEITGATPSEWLNGKLVSVSKGIVS